MKLLLKILKLFEKCSLPIINGDLLALTQLFQNLIGIAIKFQKNEQPYVKISSVIHNEQFYKIMIEDKGIGIPPEKREDIFLPFNRLHSKNDYSGSGIGLATCQNIVEQLMVKYI